MEQLTKRVCGVLNKLTPEKFDSLAEQLEEVTTDPAYMRRTIELLFTCAVEQPHLCELYAELSDHLAKKELQQKQQKLGDAAAPRASSFRRLLVEVVQSKYESRVRESSEAGSAGPDVAARARRRKLGNIDFVGELYRKRLLTCKIMHHVVAELLRGRGARPHGVLSTDAAPPPPPPAEDIEVLCRLLATIGRALEERAVAASGQQDPQHRQQIAAYFVDIARLASHTGYPPRIRFLLQDSLDSRAKGWPLRRARAVKVDDAVRAYEDKLTAAGAGAQGRPRGASQHDGAATAWGSSARELAGLSTGIRNVVALTAAAVVPQREAARVVVPPPVPPPAASPPPDAAARRSRGGED